MPIQAIWDDEAKTTIRQIYSGKLTLQDYITATDAVEDMSKEVSQTVHSLWIELMSSLRRVWSYPPCAMPIIMYHPIWEYASSSKATPLPA